MFQFCNVDIVTKAAVTSRGVNAAQTRPAHCKSELASDGVDTRAKVLQVWEKTN